MFDKVGRQQRNRLSPSATLGEAHQLASLVLRDTSMHLEDVPNVDFAELTSLPCLTKLRLQSCCISPGTEANLTNLQELCLRFGDIPVEAVDFSCCSQLHRLELDNVPTALQQLALPHGHNVQLQKLSLIGGAENDTVVLENLSYASSLAHLEICRVSPNNMREDGWPHDLPGLQRLDLQQLHCDPPRQLLCYQQLTELDLSNLARPTLPDWFTGMTHLKVLHLNECHFVAFPSCLFALTQLHRLYMEGICPPMTIPKEIASLGQWHCLQHLDLCVNNVPQGQYCLESRLQLLGLARLLEGRPVSFLYGAY